MRGVPAEVEADSLADEGVTGLDWPVGLMARADGRRTEGSGLRAVVGRGGAVGVSWSSRGELIRVALAEVDEVCELREEGGRAGVEVG